MYTKKTLAKAPKIKIEAYLKAKERMLSIMAKQTVGMIIQHPRNNR